MNDVTEPFRFFVPTEVNFGEGTFGSLRDQAGRFGSRPLIVTGRHSARAAGILERAQRQLPGVPVFDAIGENPDTAVCEAGARYCVQHHCDALVAIGGGSPMDAAKAIAVLAQNDGPCEALFGTEKYENAPLPIIAVPTTAGTGSEVTPFSVLIDPVQRTKRTIAGPALFPRVALLDPELTRSLPRAVTISTGLDALSQCMEGVVSKKRTPLGDALAFDGIRRVCAYLPRAADNGERDIEARREMLYAALLGGIIVAQSGTTLVHGMGYNYTVDCGVAHGLANALLLAPLFAHNGTVEPGRVSKIADAMGASDDNPGTAVAGALYRFLGRLGVSSAAKDHGVMEAQLEHFATAIAADTYRFRNQVGALSKMDVLRFYRQSFCGDILATT